MAATLLKPFGLDALLDTVRSVLRAAVPIVVFLACQPAPLLAQDAKPVPAPPLQSPDDASQPYALTLSVRGKCDYSTRAVAFTTLKRGQRLEQGAIVLTGVNSRTDLFFRRTGTVVRLQPSAEIAIEAMTVTTKDHLPVVRTMLDLRSGRIFVIVRSAVPGSILEVSNAAGRSVVQGSGIGRYIITADGTHVSAIGSAIPIKVVGEDGITVVSAGEVFDKKDGKKFSVATSQWVKDLIEVDELAAATEGPGITEQATKP